MSGTEREGETMAIKTKQQRKMTKAHSCYIAQ